MDIDSIYRLYFRDVFLFLQGLTHNEALETCILPVGDGVTLSVKKILVEKDKVM